MTTYQKTKNEADQVNAVYYRAIPKAILGSMLSGINMPKNKILRILVILLIKMITDRLIESAIKNNDSLAFKNPKAVFEIPEYVKEMDNNRYPPGLDEEDVFMAAAFITMIKGMCKAVLETKDKINHMPNYTEKILIVLQARTVLAFANEVFNDGGVTRTQMVEVLNHLSLDKDGRISEEAQKALLIK